MKSGIRNKKSLLGPVTGLVVLFAAGTAWADEDPQEVRKRIEAGDILSFEEIISKSEEQYPGGRVTETDLDKESGGYVYEVEIIDADGVEWDVEFDAGTGELLERKRED